MSSRWNWALTASSAVLVLATSSAKADITVDLGRGGVRVHVPSSYDETRPAPLFVLLHGYSSNGNQIKNYLQLGSLSEEYGFLYTAPNGTRDAQNLRFWNATDACCDFFDSQVDDSGYLRAFIDEIRAQLNVNDRRIYLIGHSNGGFMSYRMACDHADLIAGIMSLAGATFDDPADCVPTEPVHVLQVHGTLDFVIEYDGGNLGGIPYPGARESAETWAAYAGCLPDADDSAEDLDLDASIPGAESKVLRWEEGCAFSGSAELWTIEGGSHVPVLSAGFSRLVIEHLLAHPKPGVFEDLGFGLAGTHGLPVATGEGSLIPGTDLNLRVTNGLEDAPTTLIVGFSRFDAPFGGGTMVPLPEAVFAGLLLDGGGGLDLFGVWPSDVPAGFETFFQFWIVDPAGPEGLAATNGLRAITP